MPLAEIVAFGRNHRLERLARQVAEDMQMPLVPVGIGRVPGGISFRPLQLDSLDDEELRFLLAVRMSERHRRHAFTGLACFAPILMVGLAGPSRGVAIGFLPAAVFFFVIGIAARRRTACGPDRHALRTTRNLSAAESALTKLISEPGLSPRLAALRDEARLLDLA